MSLQPSFKGTALITGGAQRIGKYISLHLASLGYSIALHYHQSHDEAKKTALEIMKKGGECKIFHCDLTLEKKTMSLIPNVLKLFPKLNLLINNSSIFYKSNLKSGAINDFNRHFAINLKAPYILTRQFAKLCRKGQIINILDTNISKNKITHLSYLLSKKSLGDLTKLAAVELAPDIRVNAIAPGLILPPLGEKNTYLSRLTKSVPLKKRGAPSYIMSAIQFLLENDYLTGQIIFEDGGEHLV